MITSTPNPGPLLLSCGDDGLRAWIIDFTSNNPRPHGGTHITSNPQIEPPNSDGPTSCVRWYPSGKLFASGMRNGAIVFRHYEDYRVIDVFEEEGDGGGKGGGVGCLCVSGGSRYLGVGIGGVLKVLDMKTRKVDRVWRVGVDEGVQVMGIGFQGTNDSRYVACGVGGEVLLFSRASGRLVEKFEIGSGKGGGKVVSVAFSPKRVNLLVAADDTGAVYVWDVAKTGLDKGRGGRGALYAKFAAAFKAPATDLTFLDTKDHWLCVGGLDKLVRVYDLDSKRLLKSIQCPGPITAVSCSSDGVTLAAGSSMGSIFVYALRTECTRPVMTIEAAHSSVENDRYPMSSEAVRSLHFQPRYGAELAAGPKTPHAMFSTHGDPSLQKFPLKAREDVSLHKPPIDKTPARPEFFPRDSDVFSPPANTTNEVHRTNSNETKVDEQRRLQNSMQRQSQIARFMNNRRESEIIPAVRSPAAIQERSDGLSDGENDYEHLLAPSTDTTLQDVNGSRDSSANNSQRLGSNEDYCMVLSPVLEGLEEPNRNAHSVNRKKKKKEGSLEILKRSRPPKPPPVPRSRSDETGRRKDIDLGYRGRPGNANSRDGHYDDSRGSTDFRESVKPYAGLNRRNDRGQDLQETVLRRIIAEEIDALREDLRSDVINLHTEVVMSFARQTEDMRKAMENRDVAFHALKEELRIVKAENRRLRRLDA